jgi:hypothetical protein
MRNWVMGGRRKSGLWKRMKFERREKRGRESENEKREKESGEMILWRAYASYAMPTVDL